jgi:hypothetical protein
VDSPKLAPGRDDAGPINHPAPPRRASPMLGRRIEASEVEVWWLPGMRTRALAQLRQHRTANASLRRRTGKPSDPNLRRTADRLRGVPDAEGGARRNAAGRQGLSLDVP